MCVACFDSWVGLTLSQTSIQIRILKQVLAAERQRQQDTQVLLDSIAQRPGALLLTTEPTTTEAEVLAQLQTVTARQNERDAVLDAQDLRQVLRGALQANSDAEMIRTLQVGRDEMPEAIKTLQRALEAEVEREADADDPVLVAHSVEAPVEATTMYVEHGGLTRSATVISTGSHTTSSSRASTGGRGSAGTPGSRAPRAWVDRWGSETGPPSRRASLRRSTGRGSW